MTDEDKKRIVSEPPPPTDEIDGEWGSDDEQTLVRGVPEGVSKSQPAPSGAAVAGTAAAPISVPPKAAEASTPPEMKAAAPVDNGDDEEDEDEDEQDEDEDEDEQDDAPVENEDEEEEDDDEDEDEDEDEEHPAPAQTAPTGDWLPEWAPYAVLAALVSISILVGLGLVGGASAAEEGEKAAAPAASVKAPVKASPHP